VLNLTESSVKEPSTYGNAEGKHRGKSFLFLPGRQIRKLKTTGGKNGIKITTKSDVLLTQK